MLRRLGQGRVEDPAPVLARLSNPELAGGAEIPHTGRRPADVRMRQGASLSEATTCSEADAWLGGGNRPPTPVQDRDYAGCCKRTSENTPSRHSGE
jgi:hypothetical protein